jgi:cbb3-type cytochrome oxidase subunit 3
MSLTEVMSSAGLSGFAQVGFVMSFILFTLIVLWALLRPKAVMEAQARSVLDDEPKDDSRSHRKDPGNGRQ